MPEDSRWQQLKIGDLIRESRLRGGNGSSAKKLTIRLYGRGVVASTDRGGSEATNYFRRRAGQFVYSKLDCLNGAFGIIPTHLDGYETTLDLPAFDFTGRVDPQWFLKTVARPAFYGRFKFAAIGSRKANRVPTDEFLATRLSIPPLVEQRAIAAVLTAIDDTIAKSETLCSNLFAATEALTEALCERNVIGWRPSSLAAEMSSIQVGIVVKPASYYVDEGGVLALRSLNIRENRLDLKKIVRISSNGHSLNRKSSLRPGDVVTVRTGEPGTTAVVPKDLETLNCIDIIFSRPRQTLRSEYASFFLNSRVAKRQIAVLQGGLAQQHLNVGEMRRIKILVPPVGEQDRIVNILSGMWLRNDAERAALDQLKDVRAVLAQELLSGRVRLPGIIVMRHRDNPARAV
jgi:hypothetical protein